MESVEAGEPYISQSKASESSKSTEVASRILPKSAKTNRSQQKPQLGYNPPALGSRRPFHTNRIRPYIDKYNAVGSRKREYRMRMRGSIEYITQSQNEQNLLFLSSTSSRSFRI